MVFQVPQLWAIAGDGFQILLYLLILGFYIKNRALHKKYALTKTKNADGQSYNTHVSNQSAQQKVNQAFANILDTIAAERNGLDSVLGLNALIKKNPKIAKMPSNSRRPNGRDAQRISEVQTRSANRKVKVRKLSDKGLDASKISELLKIPMGEVELILSLQAN